MYPATMRTLFAVAPLAGAWIEITIGILTITIGAVAPLAGAWIEIHLRKKGSKRFLRNPCFMRFSFYIQ